MRRPSEEDDSIRKRGRPAGPPGSSLGEYLRELRLARGWTIRDLARAIGLPASSAAYISQMEAGAKTPHFSLAQRLAEQLGDPKSVFVLWSQIGGRKDPHHAAKARRELARVLGDPSLLHDARFARPGTTRFERNQELLGFEAMLRGTYGGADHAFATPRWIPQPEVEASMRKVHNSDASLFRTRALEGGYRVPILPEGQDPDDSRERLLRSLVSPQVEFVRLGSDVVQSKHMRLPFAYRMTEASVHRVGTVLKPGDVVVISQEQVPIVEHEIYAIRHQGRIELAHALWNGSQLLLLPDTGKNDFAVLDAASEDKLAHLIAGHMVTVIRAGSAPPQT